MANCRGNNAIIRSPGVFIGNIKHEPERHYVVIIPDKSELEEQEEKRFYYVLISLTECEPETEEIQIKLEKFDTNCRRRAKLFESHFVCGKCDYLSVTRNQSHKKIYKCVFCELKFCSYNCKEQHVTQEHSNGLFWQCDKCPYKSLVKDNLRHHIRIHKYNNSIVTTEKKFRRLSKFKSHQTHQRQGVHLTKPGKRFDCSSLASERGLSDHKMRVHRFQCDICAKRLKYKSSLKEHLQTHDKIPCPICQHMMPKCRLMKHIEQHQQKSFECDVCGMFFTCENDLSKHRKQGHEIEEALSDFGCKTLASSNKRQMRSSQSSAEPTLTCKLKKCIAKFSNVSDLNEHQQMHIGVGRFKCPKCNFIGERTRNVTAHIKLSH